MWGRRPFGEYHRGAGAGPACPASPSPRAQAAKQATKHVLHTRGRGSGQLRSGRGPGSRAHGSRHSEAQAGDLGQGLLGARGSQALCVNASCPRKPPRTSTQWTARWGSRETRPRHPPSTPGLPLQWASCASLSFTLQNLSSGTSAAPAPLLLLPWTNWGVLVTHLGPPPPFSLSPVHPLSTGDWPTETQASFLSLQNPDRRVSSGPSLT